MSKPSVSSLLIIGSVNVDEIATASAPLILDESNPVSWERSVGGVAANVARAAAIANDKVPVELLAVCGPGATAAELQSALAMRGVTVIPSSVSSHSTGRYSAITQTDGTLLLGLADVSQAELLTMSSIREQCTLEEAKALVLDGNLNAETLSAAAHYFRPHCSVFGVCVSPAKVNRFATALPSLSVLFCNLTEAKTLAKLLAKALNKTTAEIADLSDVQTVLQRICDSGCDYVVMTDGQRDIHVCSSSEHTTIPAVNTPAVVTLNGPGDALAGATIAECLRSNPKPTATGKLDFQTLLQAVRSVGVPAAEAVLIGKNSAPPLSPHSTN